MTPQSTDDTAPVDGTASGIDGDDTDIRRVLVVCAGDASDTGLLRIAAGRADAWGASLHLLQVVDPPSEMERIALATGLGTADIETRLVDGTREALEGTVERVLGERHVPIAVRMGKPFVETIRHVHENGIDLVVKTAEETDRPRGLLMTSADQHLIRKCHCPVWLGRPADPGPVSTVLATVDVDHGFSGEPETLAGLNRRIMRTAARIAAAEIQAGREVSVHVLHVWDAPGEGLVKLWSGAEDPDRAAEDYVGEIQAAHWQALDALIVDTRRWMGPFATARIVFLPKLARGTARRIIPEQVDALSADLLVMGTIARTGVPGLIIGNTAEDVLNSVDCAVVTVKPPGYRTPVLG